MKTTPEVRAAPGGQAEHPLLSAVRAWDRFWFRPADPTALGLIRITAGLVTLYVHLVYSIGLMNYVGRNAWMSNEVMTYLRKEVEITAPGGGWDVREITIDHGQPLWSIYHHVQDPKWIWIIHIGILTAMFLFTLGLFTRITSVLTWVGAIMYIQRSPSLLFGMDTMMNLALLYLMIAPCGAVLSVDHWLKERRERSRLGAAYVPRPPEPLVSANFATRLIQVNFCIIYLVSGCSKLLGASWWSGTAPNRVLLNYSFAPFEVTSYVQLIAFLSHHRWLWEIIMSASVLYTFLVEIGFPFMVWDRRLRWFMVCVSILLHTQIALLMGLVTFSLMMLALVLAFVPPEVVRKGIETVGDQLRQLLRVRGRAPAGKKALALSR